MSRKSGLGRGLSELIPDKLNTGENKNGKLLELDIDAVKANENQPRKHFEPEKLAELAESIRENGVIQPIIVQDMKNGTFRIIAGERRWRASQMVGLKTIPAVISEYQPDDITVVSLIENLQREDLDPIEEALAYQQMIEEYDLTQEQLAKRLGKSRSQIANTCRLLNLPEPVREKLQAGELTYGHARSLLGLPQKEQQLIAAEQIIKDGLSVRETEQMIKRMTEKKIKAANEQETKQKEKESASSRYYLQAISEMESKMRNIFGTQVKIKKKNKTNGSGKIEIEYYSDSDLERIMEIMENEFSDQ